MRPSQHVLARTFVVFWMGGVSVGLVPLLSLSAVCAQEPSASSGQSTSKPTSQPTRQPTKGKSTQGKSTNAELTNTESTKATDDDAIDVEQLNRRFKERLEGTRWTGRFTVSGEKEMPLTDERYEIHQVEKMKEGDYWRIVARVQYGDQDFTLPFVVEVKWAGRTPVITVDRMTLPGMGTFDARVLLRNGKYAGTWSHDRIGGHLFGTYRKIEGADRNEESTPDEQSPPDDLNDGKGTSSDLSIPAPQYRTVIPSFGGQSRNSG